MCTGDDESVSREPPQEELEKDFLQETVYHKQEITETLYDALKEAWNAGLTQAEIITIWEGVCRDEEAAAEEFEERRKGG